MPKLKVSEPEHRLLLMSQERFQEAVALAQAKREQTLAVVMKHHGHEFTGQNVSLKDGHLVWDEPAPTNGTANSNGHTRGMRDRVAGLLRTLTRGSLTDKETTT